MYDELVDTFRKNELSEEEVRTYKRRSEKNWLITRKACSRHNQKQIEIPVTDLIFIGKLGFPSNILYRIRCDLNLESNTKKTLSINDNLLIEAFHYIGISYDASLDYKYFLTPHHSASILYQLFLEKRCPTFLVLHPELKVLDTANNVMFGMQELSTFDNDFYEEPKAFQLSVPSRSSAIQMIEGFFSKAITDDNEYSWDCLTEQLQMENFKNELSFFLAGYVWTLKISNLTVIDLQLSDLTAECKVYFEEAFDLGLALKNLELGNPNNRSIELVHIIVDDRRTLPELSIDMGDRCCFTGDNFVGIGTWREAVFGKYFENLDIHSGDSLVATFNKMYHLTLVFDNKWFISGISKVKLH